MKILMVVLAITTYACGSEPNCEISNSGNPPEGIEVDTEGHVPEPKKGECPTVVTVGVSK